MVYVLMGEKSEAASTHIQLQVVKEKVTEEHPGCMFHGTMMTVAERAAIDAFQAVFPPKKHHVLLSPLSASAWSKTQSGTPRAARGR